MYYDEFIIQVNEIEEWSMIRDLFLLDQAFQRARFTLVGGGKVVLARKEKDGSLVRFDIIDDLDDLEAYRKKIYGLL